MEEMTAAASGMGFDPFSNHTNADLPEEMSFADSLLQLDAEDLGTLYATLSDWEFNFTSLEVGIDPYQHSYYSNSPPLSSSISPLPPSPLNNVNPLNQPEPPEPQSVEIVVVPHSSSPCATTTTTTTLMCDVQGEDFEQLVSYLTQLPQDDGAASGDCNHHSSTVVKVEPSTAVKEEPMDRCCNSSNQVIGHWTEEEEEKVIKIEDEEELHDRLPNYYTALAPSSSAPWRGEEVPSPHHCQVFNKLPDYITDMSTQSEEAQLAAANKRKLNLAEYRQRREKQLQQQRDEEERLELIRREVIVKKEEEEIARRNINVPNHPHVATSLKKETTSAALAAARDAPSSLYSAAVVSSRRRRRHSSSSTSSSSCRSYSSTSSSSSSSGSSSSNSSSRSSSFSRRRQRQRLYRSPSPVIKGSSTAASNRRQPLSSHNTNNNRRGQRYQPPPLPSGPRQYKLSSSSSSYDNNNSSERRRGGRGGGGNERRRLSSSSRGNSLKASSQLRHGQRYSDEERRRQIEERRVLYVGKVADGTKREVLRRRFERFGPVIDISLHFREHGDNYGFVTFAYKVDAYAALEHANDDAHLPRYDLSFGGRRAFCKETYADLDAVDDDNGPSANDVDFETLLRTVKAQLTSRPSTAASAAPSSSS